MAKYGVWMLESLVLTYCSKGGSSQGVRTFVQDLLPAFQSRNPQLHIKDYCVPRRHPKAVAQYRNGRSKPVCLKNMDAAGVMETISWMRSSHGRGQEYKVVRSRQLSRQPSIQGRWSVDTFASQLEARNARQSASLS
mmetsp:Transcript_13767/g.29639  ORF Transcript_13767/g.29639 Transcript_13767/m.29639 type:complete len:137 (-) Transcript_13767:1040-1450(-)